MKQAITAKSTRRLININRVGYILYLVLVIFQISTGKYDWAVANMGIALVFDPFAPLKWEDRTKFQKAVLLTHLTILIAGAIFLFL